MFTRLTHHTVTQHRCALYQHSAALDGRNCGRGQRWSSRAELVCAHNSATDFLNCGSEHSFPLTQLVRARTFGKNSEWRQNYASRSPATLRSLRRDALRLYKGEALPCQIPCRVNRKFIASAAVGHFVMVLTARFRVPRATH